jgi:hypothetical protein
MIPITYFIYLNSLLVIIQCAQLQLLTKRAKLLPGASLPTYFLWSSSQFKPTVLTHFYLLLYNTSYVHKLIPRAMTLFIRHFYNYLGGNISNTGMSSIQRIVR